MNYICGFKKKVIIIYTLFTVVFVAASITGCSLISSQLTETTLTVEQVSTEPTITEPVTETTSATTIKETTAPSELDKSREIESEFNVLEKSMTNIGEIFKFMDSNIKDATQEFSSEMVYSVMELCEEYKFDFTDKFSSPPIQEVIISILPSLEQIDLNILAGSDSQKVKDLAQEAIDKKYKLMAVEGFIMPLVDYNAYDVYRPYLTQEMNDYIDIKIDESERPSVLDAGIVIPIDDFVQRILKSMDYVKNYPDSPRTVEVNLFNNGRIYMYLSGIDNNPVFDSNNEILPNRITEYQNILAKYSDTEFGKILSDYIDLLKKENYARTQKVDDFLNNLQ